MSDAFGFVKEPIDYKYAIIEFPKGANKTQIVVDALSENLRITAFLIANLRTDVNLKNTKEFETILRNLYIVAYILEVDVPSLEDIEEMFQDYEVLTKSDRLLSLSEFFSCVYDLLFEVASLEDVRDLIEVGPDETETQVVSLFTDLHLIANQNEVVF